MTTRNVVAGACTLIEGGGFQGLPGGGRATRVPGYEGTYMIGRDLDKQCEIGMVTLFEVPIRDNFPGS